MRILWSSNSPWAHTGYGTQTRTTVPQLQALGHQVAISAFYGLQGGKLDWHGVPIYPVLHHRYGQDAIAPHAKDFRADLLISLMDVWVCQPDLFPDVPWACWFPIDHAPMPDMVAQKAARAFAPIAMSQFGAQMCADIGLDAFCIPHAIDTGIFQPMDRQQARSLTALPADRFIVGMVAANKGNPSRKAFPQQLAGFAQFQQRHPDALLYLHTDMGVSGGEVVNLPKLCDALSLQPGRDVVFADQYANALGYDDTHMAALYSSCDVLLNCSLGEGFGIPILEAQSCGTPAIVGDWTAMSELTFPGSIAIPKTDAEETYTWFEAYQWSVRPTAIADALDHIWQHAPDRAPLREAARAYDASLIRETHWKPTLAAIEARLHQRNGHKHTNGVLV